LTIELLTIYYLPHSHQAVGLIVNRMPTMANCKWINCKSFNLNFMSAEKVLAVMSASDKPLTAGKIAELSGLDKKVVDKAMNTLKAEGKIVSPVRCAWEIKK